MFSAGRRYAYSHFGSSVRRVCFQYTKTGQALKVANDAVETATLYHWEGLGNIPEFVVFCIFADAHSNVGYTSDFVGCFLCRKTGNAFPFRLDNAERVGIWISGQPGCGAPTTQHTVAGMLSGIVTIARKLPA